MRALVVFGLLAASIGVLIYTENPVYCLALVAVALWLTFMVNRN